MEPLSSGVSTAHILSIYSFRKLGLITATLLRDVLLFARFRFFADETPIRVFKNLASRGVEYPSQAMRIIASLWDGEDWATDGGQAKTNWSQAPFTAQFRGFAVDGCISPPGSSAGSCSSPGLWWNAASFRELNSSQNTAYQNVRKKYMTYDYCSDKQRFPVLPPECAMQNTR